MKILKNKGPRMEEWGLRAHLLRSFVIRQTYLQARRNSGGEEGGGGGGACSTPRFLLKLTFY